MITAHSLPSSEPEFVILHDQAHPSELRDFRHSLVADFALDDIRHIRIHADKVKNCSVWLVDMAISHTYTQAELGAALEAAKGYINRFYVGGSFNVRVHLNPRSEL